MKTTREMSRFEIVNGEEKRIETARDRRISEQVRAYEKRIREASDRALMEAHGTTDLFEIWGF